MKHMKFIEVIHTFQNRRLGSFREQSGPSYSDDHGSEGGGDHNGHDAHGQHCLRVLQHLGHGLAVGGRHLANFIQSYRT